MVKQEFREEDTNYKKGKSGIEQALEGDVALPLEFSAGRKCIPGRGCCLKKAH